METNIIVQGRRMENAIELQTIQSRVFEVRGHKVMIDFHLAEMYGVETRVLKQAVRRNTERFPSDFMFELTRKEALELISIGVSQSVIPPDYNFGLSNPFVFTEQGVSMLSTVLKSKSAIQMNILIMRAFVMLRQYALGYAELNQKLENFMIETNMQFSEVYQALTELVEHKKELEKPRRRIGFNSEEFI